jgi:hypothetical protein
LASACNWLNSKLFSFVGCADENVRRVFLVENSTMTVEYPPTVSFVLEKNFIKLP